MIAVNGGINKTEFVLFDDEGRIINSFFLKGCNPSYTAMDEIFDTLKSGINILLGHSPNPLGIYIGISGYTISQKGNEIKEKMKQLYPHIKLRCKSDVYSVIASASNDENCISAKCTTNVVVYVTENNSLHRFGAWDMLLDNGGSIFDIGKDVLRSVLLAREGRGEKSKLTDLAESRLGGDIKYAEPNYCISLSIPEIPSDINAISTPCDWAKESIDKAQALNISEASRIYDYTNPITREEFCELIYNYVKLLGKLDGKTTETKFTDSSNEKVIVLSNMGIIEGKSETEFAPLDTLTREEAATILARVAYSVFDGPAVTSNRITFADYSEMSDWARNHIQNIYKWGIMKGVGTATENNIPVFAPKDTLTSEQAIATIVRMYEKNPVSEPVVKFVDSAGNIIISDKDIISCEIEYNKISQSLPEEPYIHFVITDEARAVFKEATARISDYSENYIHIIINAETISSPIVAAEIDSSDILLKISDGRDLDSLIKIINDAIK